jgi:magnesium-protoporphyrin IX monomethyl ester (oxidative) cyclase
MSKIALLNITKDLECPPLNLAYIGAYLERENKSKVKIIDINFDNIYEEIKKFKPDIIGISSFTIKFNLAKEIAQNIKKFYSAPIIIGGVHISTHKKSFSKEFDMAVLGEGEETISKIIKLYDQKKFNAKEFKKLKGLLFWEGNNIVDTGAKELMKNIDILPIPNRHLLNKKYFLKKKSYNKIHGEEVIETGIITSRGCPYKCSFCSSSAFWNRIRFHSPKYIAKEIESLVKNFKINYIVVYDDFFAISKERLDQIIEELKKRKILGKVKFSCCARANVINDELCESMKQLGIITVNFGFESGSDKILKELKGDNVTVEQNINAVKKCISHGLNVSGSFIIGSPGETLENMKETLKIIKKMRKIGASELWCGVAVPYPGTKLWEYAKKKNLLKNFSWEKADPSYIHEPIFLEKSINQKDFIQMFKEIKNESQEINPNKQKSLIRNLKELFYYNYFLYKLSGRVLNNLPQSIRNKIFKKLNLRENLIS